MPINPTRTCFITFSPADIHNMTGAPLNETHHLIQGYMEYKFQ
ncbi:hypothetical protein B194_1455 [Serratia plymuthica A30]|nr:hypothetical protein B194_1455 [Serratia plymuthica A30]